MPAFAIPTDMTSSSLFDSQLPSDNTSSTANGVSYAGTNDTIHCNYSSPLTSYTRNPTSRYDIRIISPFDIRIITLIIYTLGMMAYFICFAYICMRTRKTKCGKTSKEKKSRCEKISGDFPERSSSTSLPCISTSLYTVPQHKNSLPASTTLPVQPVIAAYETTISEYKKRITDYETSIDQYKTSISLFKTNIDQYKSSIGLYQAIIDQYETDAGAFRIAISESIRADTDLMEELAESRTSEQEKTKRLAELGHRLAKIGIDDDELLRMCGMTPRPHIAVTKADEALRLASQRIIEVFR
jgi:hypothetical protein